MKDDYFTSRFFLKAIVFLFTIVLLCLLFFALGGLDISDDGFYLASARYPKEVLASISSFYCFTALLFKLLHYNVVLLRWFSVFGIAASGMAVGWALGEVFPLVQPTCMAFTGLGAMLYFVRGGLFTPSYNTLISIAINLSTVLFLLYYKSHLQSVLYSRKKSLLLVLQGFLIGLCLLIKIPCGILLLFFWLGAIFLSSKFTNIFVLALSLLGGIFLSLLLFFGFIEQFPTWLVVFKNGLNSLSAGGHELDSLIMSYFQDIQIQLYVLIVNDLPILFLLLAIIGINYFFSFRTNFSPKFSNLAFFAILLLVSLDFIMVGYHIGGEFSILEIAQFYIFWIVISAGTAFIFYWIRKFLRQKNVVTEHTEALTVLVALGVLPVIGTLGTQNPLSVSILMNLAPWFGCYALIFLFILKSDLIQRWSGLLLLIIAFFATSQIISASIFFPYRINTGILEQNTSISLGTPPTKFFLDQQSADFFFTMKHIAAVCGFKAGDNMMGFLDMPGVVYALGANPIGTSWWIGTPYTGNSPEQIMSYNNYILSLLPSSQVRKAYILEKVDPLNIVPDLSTKGIVLPRDYQFCGEVVWPFDQEKIRLWKPR